MRIVGIDCGSNRTGYGVIDTDGRTHRLISAGVVHTIAREPFEQRLKCIANGLRTAIETFAPDAVAVEEVFYAVNARSALKLAHVRGVALLIAAQACLPVSEYSALEVKMSVVGYGRAEKSQVDLMVRSLLKVEQTFDSYDATDALAVAICHSARAHTAMAMERR